MLTRVFPPELINEILNSHGCNSARVRSFPAAAVVYYTMALSMFPQAAYEEVFGEVIQGLASDDGAPLAPVPVVKSTISKARSRLDWRALQAIQRRCCLALAGSQDRHAFFAGYRLVAIETASLEVCDQQKNVQTFGYPSHSNQQVDGPQARYALLVECGTKAILDAELGPCALNACGIAAALLRSLRPDMLCLAERPELSWAEWHAARNSGAQLLWRIADNLILPIERTLADGSYLSRLQLARTPGNISAASVMVRVLEPHIVPSAATASRPRLLTTLLDDESAPAAALVRLYCARPRVDLHLGHGRRALRSKTPELVRQEFYGLIMAHYATRWSKYQHVQQLLAAAHLRERIPRYA